MYALSKVHSDTPSAEAHFLATLVPASTARSNKGTVKFKDLFIPPPPAPKLASPSPVGQVRRQTVPCEDNVAKELNVISLPKGQKPTTRSVSLSTKASSTSAKLSPCTSPNRHLGVEDAPAISGSDHLSASRKKTTGATSKAGKKSPSKRIKLTEKEKLLQGRREKFCLLGQLVCKQ